MFVQTCATLDCFLSVHSANLWTCSLRVSLSLMNDTSRFCSLGEGEVSSVSWNNWLASSETQTFGLIKAGAHHSHHSSFFSPTLMYALRSYCLKGADWQWGRWIFLFKKKNLLKNLLIFFQFFCFRPYGLMRLAQHIGDRDGLIFLALFGSLGHNEVFLCWN